MSPFASQALTGAYLTACRTCYLACAACNVVQSPCSCSSPHVPWRPSTRRWHAAARCCWPAARRSVCIAPRKPRRADSSASGAPRRARTSAGCSMRWSNRREKLLGQGTPRRAPDGWSARRRDARRASLKLTDLEEAARRINALLGELKTSHTGLLTPDDVDYYNLLDVFSGSRGARNLAKQFRSGVHYAGIGIFSVRIDGRDFVDAVLEGSPAERAGLKVGDEIVSVDGAPLSPDPLVPRPASARRRLLPSAARASGPIESVRVDVVQHRAAEPFSDATLASARVIERDGRRIGYVHVWASVGDQCTQIASSKHSTRLGVEGGVARSQDPSPQRRSPARRAHHRHARQDRRHGRHRHAATSSCIDPRGPRYTLAQQARSRPAIDLAARAHRRSDRSSHAQHGRAVRPLLQARTAGAADRHAHGWRGQRPRRRLPCRRQPALSGRDRAWRSTATSWKGHGVAPDIAVQRSAALLRRRRSGAGSRGRRAWPSARRGSLPRSPSRRATVNNPRAGIAPISAHLLSGQR